MDFSLFKDGNFGWAGATVEENEFDKALTRPDFNIFSQDDFISEVSSIKSEAFDSDVEAYLFNLMEIDEGWCFYTATDLLLGDNASPPGPQNMGNCVAASAVLTQEDEQCNNIVLKGEPEKFFPIWTPPTYGFGRVFVGNNSIRGDGSVGLWQIEACMKYGNVPYDSKSVWPNEPRIGSRNANRTLGSSKSKLQKFVDEANPYKIERTAKITNFEKAKDIVCKTRCPFTVASNLWFRSAGYDRKYGLHLYKIGGRAAHQTYCRAIVKIKGSWFVYQGNQWGEDYHGDPGKGPKGGFWVPASEYDRFLRSSYAYAYDGFTGRPAIDFKLFN